MMKQLIVFFLLAACATDDDVEEAPAVEGPALVMFYTDN